MKGLKLNKYGSFVITLFLSLIALLTSGCVYGARANRPYVGFEPQSISMPNVADEVSFRITANVWSAKPKNLKRYVLPFYVEIKNNTDQDIIISDSDFILLDDQANQYNTISAERTAAILKESDANRFYVYPRVSIGVGTSFHHDRFHYYGHHRYPFYRPYYRPYYYYDDYPYPYYRSRYYETDVEDIYIQALNTGVIRPGAKLSGYVYFNKLPQDTRQLTLEVGYLKQRDNIMHRLDFHFDLIEVYSN